MSARIALPLRLVQCNLATAASSPSAAAAANSDDNTASSSFSSSQVLTPYKPCGLPCYAASQVSAVTHGGSSGGGDGRRLFAVHTRHASATAAGALSYEAGAQPRPEDPSDSLLSRIVDASLPGCRPYIALPVLSSLLRRGGAPGAGLLNQWTARHKGLVVVTQNPSDALFLRNAAQLDLVQQTFRVVCRLPAGVAPAVRQHLLQQQRRSELDSRGVGGGAAAVLLNPYLQSHAERQRRAQQAVDLTEGIPLTGSEHSASSSFASQLRLPAGVRPSPLVKGGFFDVARGLLRVQGSVKCYLRAQTPLTARSAQRVRQFTRLQGLFTSPVSSPNEASEAGVEGGHAVAHPWLRPEWRIGVSLDAAHLTSVSSPAGGSDDDSQGTRAAAAAAAAAASSAVSRGKALAFDFRLVSVSAHATSDVALYEVHARGDVSADEIAAVFHAEGLTVLNDYVQDVSLANRMEEVAQRIRASPPGLLADLPIGLQHYLRTATAEELVALPLTLLPLEDADRLCVAGVLDAASSSSSNGRSGGTAMDLAEDRDRLQRFVTSFTDGSGGGSRRAVQRLLWHSLETLNPANAEERQTYAQLLGLALGSGVECTSVAFPDPASPSTVLAMQHVWLTFEQQRQRHPSLAAAAHAARQHPAAAELHYLRRSVLSDVDGLARVPLLEDYAADCREKKGELHPQLRARGECSFSQAVALCCPTADPPAAAAASPGSTAPLRADAAEAVAGASVAWDAVDVPPSYAAAYSAWAATALASPPPAQQRSADTECSGRAMESAVARVGSLWPSPATIKQRVASLAPERGALLARQDSAAEMHEAAASVSAHTGVRVFLRVEELAELTCAHCGAQGHTWQHCAARTADAVAALEGGTRHVAAFISSPPLLADTPGSTSEPSALLAKPHNGTSIMEEEGITTVEDAAAALADQAEAMALATRSRRMSDVSDGSTSASSSPLIAVPNAAATQQYKAAHILRSESRKPSVHRRAMRCVYCGGRHHITACPKLSQEQEGEYEAGRYSATERPGRGGEGHHEQQSLFCIKCGETGHGYLKCPRLPVGLHSATHCPICQQPRTGGSHDPLHCPQRVAVPAGYRLSGVPHSQAAAAGGSERVGSRHRYEDASGSGPRGRDGFARPSRRRGSVLIADSFVDSSARHKR